MLPKNPGMTLEDVQKPRTSATLLGKPQGKGPRLYKNNRIFYSEHYTEIVKKFNEEFATRGKVNAMKFYRDVVKPLIPEVSRVSWYNFLKTAFSSTGLVSNGSAEIVVLPAAQPDSGTSDLARLETERELLANLKAASVATRVGIARALNIGLDALEEILENPELMKPADRAELLFKAMRAQDSRVFAVAAVKKDLREEDAFQKSFNEAVYAD